MKSVGLKFANSGLRSIRFLGTFLQKEIGKWGKGEENKNWERGNGLAGLGREVGKRRITG